MNSKLNRLISLFKENIRLFISISLGVFLFILFFQPFPLDRFEFNNKLLFATGFGFIAFLIMFFLRIIYRGIIQRNNENGYESSYPSYLNDFIIVTLCSVAFAFYLKYVGSVSISFHIIFKVILICLSIPIVLRVKESNEELKKQNETLIAEKKSLQKEVANCEDDNLNKTIEFNSENNSEIFKLLIANIVYFKSADNYVEIIYKEKDTFKKKLIRNTLKNIELHIKQYPGFMRCHRTYIINRLYIEKLNKRYNNHSLSIREYDEQIPVSRQYLLKLKEGL